LPITVGGAGAREAVYIQLCVPLFGMPEESALAASIGLWGAHLAVGAAIWAVLVLMAAFGATVLLSSAQHYVTDRLPASSGLATTLGIEFNPDLVALSTANARAAGVEARATFVRGDIFEYWFHAAAYLPMRDYRFALPRMLAIRNGERHWFADRDRDRAAAQLRAMGVQNVRNGGLYSLHMTDPFGFDIQHSSSDRESPERGIFAGYFFPGQRDRGAMLQAHLGAGVRIYAGAFNGNRFFTDADRRLNYNVRVRKVFDRLPLAAGLSAQFGRQLVAGGMPDKGTDNLLGVDVQWAWRRLGVRLSSAPVATLRRSAG